MKALTFDTCGPQLLGAAATQRPLSVAASMHDTWGGPGGAEGISQVAGANLLDGGAGEGGVGGVAVVDLLGLDMECAKGVGGAPADEFAALVMKDSEIAATAAAAAQDDSTANELLGLEGFGPVSPAAAQAQPPAPPPQVATAPAPEAPEAVASEAVVSEAVASQTPPTVEVATAGKGEEAEVGERDELNDLLGLTVGGGGGGGVQGLAPPPKAGAAKAAAQESSGAAPESFEGASPVSAETPNLIDF